MSFEAETSDDQTSAVGSDNQTQSNNEGQPSRRSQTQTPKSRAKSKNSVFGSKAILKGQAKLATTSQLKVTYELLGTILSERERADAEALRIEKEQTEQAEALLAQAKASGIPDHILQKVMAK
ncbi:hypothetical protein [Vibrio sp. 10N.239.312.D08]|uniref:hypothetical protein n=1 Tax=Vibrio sp. 10N.239.312.D08 TaxID=3229978 RepID=UPI00354D4D37